MAEPETWGLSFAPRQCTPGCCGWSSLLKGAVHVVKNSELVLARKCYCHVSHSVSRVKMDAAGSRTRAPIATAV